MYPEKNPWISTDDARGRQGSVPGRPLRPSPSCLKQTAPFPSYPRTDGDLPSRPVPRNFGRTGRLRTLATRKSLRGHVFLRSNGAVSWQSRKQDLIAMTTLEAEYIFCSEGSWAAKWLLQLHRDKHGKDASPLPINCDYQGALSHITTGIITARTKHMDFCYHNSRDLHARKIVDCLYVHMNENVADILIKASTKDKHEKFTKAIGLW